MVISAPRTKALRLKEADILRTILDYLRIHRVFHWRNQTAGGRLGQRFVRIGVLGAPDIFIVHRGKCIGIEVKSPEGKQREEQIAFGMEFSDAGGIYRLARGIEEVDEVLRYVERNPTCP